MNAFPVPKHCCSCCNRELAAANSNDHHAPRPGDISICLYCGMIAEFDPNMCLQRIDDAEMDKVRKSAIWKTIVEMQQKLIQFGDKLP